MPSPVLALPWASRSRTSVRRPAAASAVAKLMAVVVLPTPPFWLATATMRARRTATTARGSASAAAMLTGYLLQAKNDPPRIGNALAKRRRHSPVFAGEGQFILDPLPLEKEALGPVGKKRLGEPEQPVERRASAGGDDIDRVRRDRLYAARANRHIDLGDARRLAGKGAFPRIRLDQRDPGRAKNRQNQTGKTRPAAEIDHALRAIGDERLQLRGIEDVPTPQIDEGIAADEVDARRPTDQQRSVRLE